MATERTTTREDGTTERVVERDGPTYIDRGGSGIGGVIIGVAVLALVAIIAFFLLNANRNDVLRTNATTSAAQAVADSANAAARDMGNAANTAAGSVSGAASSVDRAADNAASEATSSANNAANSAADNAPPPPR